MKKKVAYSYLCFSIRLLPPTTTGFVGLISNGLGGYTGTTHGVARLHSYLKTLAVWMLYINRDSSYSYESTSVGLKKNTLPF